MVIQRDEISGGRVEERVAPAIRASIIGGVPCAVGYTSHVGGSNYETQRHSPATLLRFCYLRSPDLAVKNRLGSIAFPGMGTGAGVRLTSNLLEHLARQDSGWSTCLSTWLVRVIV